MATILLAILIANLLSLHASYAHVKIRATFSNKLRLVVTYVSEEMADIFSSDKHNSVIGI